MMIRRCLLTLAAVVLAAAAQGALAQSQATIPNEIAISDKPLTGPQQQSVATFVSDLGGQLQNGEDQQVAAAALKLTEPLSAPGVTDLFKKTFSLEVVKKINSGIASDRLVVRINTMIVASQLYDVGVVDLAVKALADSSPAVRYWAARSVSEIVNHAPLAPSDKKKMLEALITAQKQEQAPEVSRVLLLAEVDLNTFESISQALTVLDEQVNIFARQPEQSLDGAIDGLGRLLRNMVQSDAGGQVPSEKLIRRFTAVSYRYVLLGLGTLSRGQKIAPEYRYQLKELVKLGDKVLRWTVKKMAPEAKEPAPNEALVASDRWAELMLQIQDGWAPVLKAPPIGLKPEEIATPTAAQP